MARRPVVLVATATVLVGLVPATAVGDEPPNPGAPGIGEPNLTLEGKGGY